MILAIRLRLAMLSARQQALASLAPRACSLSPLNPRRRLCMKAQASNGQQPEAARHSLSVAVVGGGAAGLAAARELLRAGHRVTVLEARPNVGGVWDYTDEVEDDPLGQGSWHVHGSMYRNLRTNLPREVMGFADFPFDAAFPGSRDPRQFCGHEEVQCYLEAFANEFGLRQHVRMGTEVLRVAPVRTDGSAAAAAEGGSGSGSSSSSSAAPVARPRWEVTTRPAGEGAAGHQGQQTPSSSSTTEQYDAVVVANGHYSRPRLPDIPGQQDFPGLVMHSHNYRTPEGYRGKRVLLLGASSSGVDIAEEIAKAGATQVWLSAREWENPLTGQVLDISDSSIPGSSDNKGAGGTGSSSTRIIIKVANLVELHADGAASLADGSRVETVDVVMFCTGYEYSFPFLESSGVVGPGAPVAVEDNRVGPLYQHIFPPALAPSLSFVGLCWKVVPFPQFELQSRWVARVLAGAATLPSQQEMELHTAEFYASLAAAGVPQRYTHRQSGGVQWEYARWLATQCGEEADETWREEMYTACGLSRKLNAGRYRDSPLPGAEAAEAAARRDAARVRQGMQRTPAPAAV